MTTESAGGAPLPAGAAAADQTGFPAPAADPASEGSPPPADPSRGSESEPAPKYDLQRHGNLVGSDGEGAEVLQGFAADMREARLPALALDRSLEYFAIGTASGWADAEALVRDWVADVGEAHARTVYQWLQRQPRAKQAAVLRGAAAPAVTAADLDERAAIEQRMRADRGGYNRDADAQARYRELVTAGEGERPMPSAPDAIAREIADIEAMMRTDRRAYNRDVKLQRRYRDLLALRG